MSKVREPLRSAQFSIMYNTSFLIFLLLTICVFSCDKSVAENLFSETNTAADVEHVDRIAKLGKKMFFDPALSASGRMSCASCHAPDHAYGPPNALPAQFGGAHLQAQGKRAVPSLAYTLKRTPRWFQERATKPQEQNSETHPPVGGFGWDGRVDTLHAQAALPLLSADEMANNDKYTVVKTVQHAAYAGEFQQIFGRDIFSNSELAFTKITEALETFELNDASFHPFTSKYDAYLDGATALNAQEQHGLELFNDASRGNCAFCHPSAKGADGSHPIFTNYQFEALGVPRNVNLKMNTNAEYFDLGLCGPLRTDQPQALFCGMFKTPTLRNVALRRVFFHNGYFHNLEDALRFYVQRDTHPEKWYPRGKHGHIEKFNDLPEAYRINVDTIDIPLNRKRGDEPALNEAEIRDLVAFLATLNDGYRKK